MNIQPSISQTFFTPPHAINKAQPAAHETKIDTEKKVEADASTSNQTKSTNSLERSPEEKKLIQELRATDREVRAHEMAHQGFPATQKLHCRKHNKFNVPRWHRLNLQHKTGLLQWLLLQWLLKREQK